MTKKQQKIQSSCKISKSDSKCENFHKKIQKVENNQKFHKFEIVKVLKIA